MSASRHAGDITFYEELGVASGATAEEIREAFRGLARILHPDQQTDPHLKLVAERQMRKLNRIYAVLADPERRRSYNKGLREDRQPIIFAHPILRPSRARKSLKLLWIAGIAAAAGLTIWFTGDGLSAAPGRWLESGGAAYAATLLPKSSPVNVDQISRVAQLESDLHTATLERDAALEELDRLRRAAPETSEDALRSAHLAGSWFYSSSPDGNRHIEVVISEKNGIIDGKYQAHFRATDESAAQEIDFSFRGSAAGMLKGSALKCPWNGPTGSNGEITLRLVSDQSLRVEWTVTDPGSRFGLDGGTAVLTRRAE